MATWERRVERPAREQLAGAAPKRGRIRRRVEDVEDDRAHLAHVVLDPAADLAALRGRTREHHAGRPLYSAFPHGHPVV